jgi:hypothetical protein
LLVTKNILLARKKTLAIIIALLDDVGAAITDNQTWFTFILFSVENVILRVSALKSSVFENMSREKCAFYYHNLLSVLVYE